MAIDKSSGFLMTFPVTPMKSPLRLAVLGRRLGRHGLILPAQLLSLLGEGLITKLGSPGG
jgi:hypothetical protein